MVHFVFPLSVEQVQPMISQMNLVADTTMETQNEPEDQQLNNNDNMNQDIKKPRSSLKQSFKNKINQIFKHNNSNTNNDDITSNTINKNDHEQRQSTSSSTQQSNHTLGTKTNVSSMHGARTQERLATIAALQKNKSKENRHSLGMVQESSNKNINNNENNIHYDDKSNNYINKRYSLAANLKKQEEERKMLQQKAKEQQKN